MTTPYFKKFRKQVSEVNDQLCYFYFSDAQSLAELQRASIEAPDALTVETFTSNPFVRRLCVRNDALAVFRAKAMSTMAGVALVFAVEALLRYLEKLQDFGEELSPSGAVFDKDTVAEDRLTGRLEAWHGQLDTPIVKTIRYLRVRRNQVAHDNRTPHKAYVDAIRNDAHLLEKYWLSQPIKLPGLDFAQLDALTFTTSESLSLMNLCAVCLVKVDDAFIKCISIEKLENRQISDFAKNNRHSERRTMEVRFRRFKRQFKAAYGLNVQCDLEHFRTEIEKIIKEVG
jgi:hypothetical protein